MAKLATATTQKYVVREKRHTKAIAHDTIERRRTTFFRGMAKNGPQASDPTAHEGAYISDTDSLPTVPKQY